jgi:hypothetical protein
MKEDKITASELNYILKGMILGSLAILIGLALYMVHQYQIIINMNQ